MFGPHLLRPDILLHQSGHIMLSDFDLAKSSNDPAGMPAMVHSETNGIRVRLISLKA
jgi:protein-serine/threonine kinase